MKSRGNPLRVPLSGGVSEQGPPHGLSAFSGEPGASLSCNTGSVTLLPIASVVVESDQGPVKADLIFDGGTDKSFVSERLMKR